MPEDTSANGRTCLKNKDQHPRAVQVALKRKRRTKAEIAADNATQEAKKQEKERMTHEQITNLRVRWLKRMPAVMVHICEAAMVIIPITNLSKCYANDPWNRCWYCRIRWCAVETEEKDKCHQKTQSQACRQKFPVHEEVARCSNW